MYLQECHASVENDRNRENSGSGQHYGPDEEDFDVDDAGEAEQSRTKVTEASLQAIIRTQTSIEEEIHGRLAVEIAKRAKIFSNNMDDDKWVISEHIRQ